MAENKYRIFYCKPKTWVWLIIALYIYVLPGALIIFLWFEKSFTLVIVKKTPPIIIGLLSVCYLWHCYQRNIGYHVLRFIIPTIAILLGVVLLESNPIKYIHIPEYMLLVVLIFIALYHHSNKHIVLLTAVICSILLGVVDEVHQGIHPGRYFGWKDMLINAAGSVIGALFISTLLAQQEIDAPTASTKNIRLQRILLLCTTLLAVTSVIQLLAAAAHGTLTPHYPSYYLAANIIMCLLGTFYAIQFKAVIAQDSARGALLYWPMNMFTVLHSVIIFAYVNAAPFQ